MIARRSLPLRPALVHSVREADEERLHAGRCLRKCLNPCPQPFLTGRFRWEGALSPGIQAPTPRGDRKLLPQHLRALGGGRGGHGKESQVRTQGHAPSRHVVGPPVPLDVLRKTARSASNSRTLASSPRMVSAWSAIL